MKYAISIAVMALLSHTSAINLTKDSSIVPQRFVQKPKGLGAKYIQGDDDIIPFEAKEETNK